MGWKSPVASSVIKMSSPQALPAALRVLRRGGLIVFPTETSYGLGADVTNERAVKRVFSIKQMPASRKVSVMVSGKAMAQGWVGKDKRVDALIDAFLPGPLTIVHNSRSFRIPDYGFCRRLVNALGKPITSTSANIHGTQDNYSIKRVIAQLKGVDLFIDGGRLPRRKPSTVFDVDTGMVLRKGPIPAYRIQQVLKE